MLKRAEDAMSANSPDEPVVEILSPESLGDAVDVLAEAFFDYPVMRYVIGDRGDEYPRRLRRLVEFFTMARFVRGDLVLAVRAEERIVAVANVNRPSTGTAEPTTSEDPLEPHRAKVWDELGAGSRSRYERYGEVAAQSPFPKPSFHLGMIGVRRAATGHGHAGRLLERLHRLSADHPESRGVSLATEIRRNVALYEHFGYRVVSRSPVGDFETWGLFRAESRAA
jgi:ribosomal protein S18 acetylase RimI-like enzyme